MVHDLKIEDNYLENLISGKKKMEIRFNDRDYQRGDLLRFKRYHYANPVKEYLFEVFRRRENTSAKDNPCGN